MTASELAASRALFVQPHFDDIALSCGGTVARTAAAGERPIVVTVFSGGVPEAELTTFAKDLHARWAIGATPWLVRGDEDERAVAALGAAWHRLGHGEAIYRGYDTWPGMFGRIHERDAPLVEILAGELEALWRSTHGARVYLPLGVGGHVDHQVCHAVAAKLAARGAEIVCYEDFPYATLAGRLERRLAQLATPYSVEVVDVTDWIQQRLDAIGCYASQLSLFAADGPYPGPFEGIVRRHAAWIGGGDARLGECFFRAA